jgi:hypothetical protein
MKLLPLWMPCFSRKYSFNICFHLHVWSNQQAADPKIEGSNRAAAKDPPTTGHNYFDHCSVTSFPSLPLYQENTCSQHQRIYISKTPETHQKILTRRGEVCVIIGMAGPALEACREVVGFRVLRRSRDTLWWRAWYVRFAGGWAARGTLWLFLLDPRARSRSCNYEAAYSGVYLSSAISSWYGSRFIHVYMYLLLFDFCPVSLSSQTSMNSRN